MFLQSQTNKTTVSNFNCTQRKENIPRKYTWKFDLSGTFIVVGEITVRVESEFIIRYFHFDRFLPLKGKVFLNTFSGNDKAEMELLQVVDHGALSSKNYIISTSLTNAIFRAHGKKLEKTGSHTDYVMARH